MGGLDWSEIRPKIERVLGKIDDLKVVVFEPSSDFTSKAVVKNKEVPEMTAGRAALVGLMQRYLNGLLDPFVTLLEVHKLMYFMQEAGEPLKLRYQKAQFGPYAENLRHVLHAIEGHLVSGYADGGDSPDKRLELIPGAIEDAELFLKSKAETRSRFEKVTDLVEGFETPFGLELLATVHWVIEQDKIKPISEIISQVYAWSDRKKQFSKRQVELATEILSSKNWVRT